MDHSFVKSPLGLLKLSADATSVREISFDADPPETNAAAKTQNSHLQQLEEELSLYFSRKLEAFTCAIDPRGSEFQIRNWRQLSLIPFGITKSYSQIAAEIEQPKASRAVGGAINRNPIPIVIPCHRVIGANGKLVGFAGGLWRKQWMLEHEGASLPLNRGLTG